jgi:hypothetical membrane protein
LTLASRRRIALAGTLLLIGGAWTILSIAIAESLTPGYSISNETISGLGSPIFSGTCNNIPSCVTPIQPASAIYVFAKFLNRIVWLWSGSILKRATGHRRFALAISVVGVANILVGASYLPFYLGGTSATVVVAAGAVHAAGALTTFVLAPVAAISGYRFTRAPLRYFSLVLGAFALAANFLWLTGNYFGMGYGGMERMVAYPLYLWAIGFGASIMGGLEWDAQVSNATSSS